MARYWPEKQQVEHGAGDTRQATAARDGGHAGEVVHGGVDVSSHEMPDGAAIAAGAIRWPPARTPARSQVETMMRQRCSQSRCRRDLELSCCMATSLIDMELQ